MSRPHIVTRYGCLNPTDLVTHVAIGLCVQTLSGSKITESIHMAGGLFCLLICILNDKYQVVDVLHLQNVWQRMFTSLLRYNR